MKLNPSKLCLLGLGLVQSVNSMERPNVVFIMSDQHQKMAVGCLGSNVRTVMGGSVTPNIDSLAANGILYTNAYTPAPLSAPARASLTTGCYPSHHTALRHKYNGKGSGESRFPGILPDLPCFAELFRKAGYSTAAIGKMHVHGELKGVNDLGYDYVDLRFYTEYPGAHYADRANGDWNRRYREMDPYKKKTYREIDGDKYSEVDPSVTVKDNHNNVKYLETLVEEDSQMFDYLVAEESIKFMEKCVKENKPFFINVGFEKPHEPYTTTRKYMDLYNPDDMPLPEEWNQFNEDGPFPFLMNWLPQKHGNKMMAKNTMAGYYACVSSMDEQLGKVIETCKRLGIYDNTIFVYTTDHGENMYQHGLLQKHCMFESAVGVPMIISYPKALSKGKVSDNLVSTLDLLPTILELSDIEVPSTFDGVSLINNSAEDKDRYVYSEFYEAGQQYKMFPKEKMVPMRMCRWKNYKYIYTHGFIGQLYDLEADPNEQHNLAISPSSEISEIIEQLRFRALADWTVDDFPLLSANVERTGKNLKFTINENIPSAIKYVLYASETSDFEKADKVIESDKNTILIKDELGNERYYWIMIEEKMERTLGPSKLYSGVKVATSVFPANIPMTVEMKVTPKMKEHNFKYNKVAVYTE